MVASVAPPLNQTVRRQKSCGEELTMAEKLDPRQVVTFEELLRAMIFEQYVVVRRKEI